MATKRTVDERLAELQERKKQLEEQEKKLKSQKTKEERKKREHRLRKLGGAVFKVLNEDSVEGDIINENDVADLIAFLKSQNKRGNYFTTAMHRTPKPKEEPPASDTSDTEDE